MVAKCQRIGFCVLTRMQPGRSFEEACAAALDALKVEHVKEKRHTKQAIKQASKLADSNMTISYRELV